MNQFCIELDNILDYLNTNCIKHVLLGVNRFEILLKQTLSQYDSFRVYTMAHLGGKVNTSNAQHLNNTNHKFVKNHNVLMLCPVVIS